MARDGWNGKEFTVSRQRLDEARSGLGIAQPVELKLTRYRNVRGTVGALIGLRNGVCRIAVDTYSCADEVSCTISHELAHIVQAQRVGGVSALTEIQTEELGVARLIGPDQ